MGLAVILDMDGLMLDTEPISLRAWKDSARSLGHALDDDVCDRMIGLGALANREMLMRQFGETFPADELSALAHVVYRRQLDTGGVPHKPGLVEFIRFLDEHSIPRAVATSTETNLATYNLRQAGVLSHFDVIVGGDQVRRGKPEPDIFLMAAARLGCPAGDCIVLEDSGPGIRAAAAAGMRPILIPDGRDPSEETRRVAYAVVDSLLSAKLVIERLMRRSGEGLGDRLMNILIFGASGSAGGSVLRACLSSPAVKEVRSVMRRPLSIEHARLRTIVHTDYQDYAPIAHAFEEIDACLFCLGISVTQVSGEAEYRRITHDFAVAAARTLRSHSPDATFHYISGRSTRLDSRFMWARVKAETERELIELGGAVCWRPAAIDGMPSVSEPRLYRFLRPAFRLFRPFRSLYVTGEDLGVAMLQATVEKMRARVIENAEIRDIADRAGAVRG